MHAIVRLLTLLAGDTDSLTVTASGASLLSTDTDTPSVTETTVSTALPETLEGFAHLGVEQISVDMGGLAILNVLLGVNEPRWHELQRVLDNSDDLIDLLGSQLAGTAKTHINFIQNRSLMYVPSSISLSLLGSFQRRQA